MALVRCGTCRGIKLVNGLGGLLKDCPTCKATGFVEEIKKAEVIPAQAPEPAPLEEAFKEIMPDVKFVTIESVTSVDTLDTSEKHVDKTVDIKHKKKDVKAIAKEKAELAGYTDLMLEAIMSEPGMDPLEWSRKYASIVIDPLSIPTPEQMVGKLPDKHIRKQFRESIAFSTPPAPRTYNVMKSQDVAYEIGQ